MKIYQYTIDLHNVTQLNEHLERIFGKDRIVHAETNDTGMFADFKAILTEYQTEKLITEKKRYFADFKKYGWKQKDIQEKIEEEEERIRRTGIGISKHNVPVGTKIWKHYKNKSVVCFEKTN